jgi:hypothetical protein
MIDDDYNYEDASGCDGDYNDEHDNDNNNANDDKSS